jgi:hypothetical protein
MRVLLHVALLAAECSGNEAVPALLTR